MATQSERREATRAAIVKAAKRLFGERGFAGTTMDHVATAAHVAKGAVYHHFKTKEALFEAVFDQVSNISSPKSSGQRAPKTMRSRRWPREPRPTSPPARPTQPARSFFATGRPCWAGSAGAKSMPGISAADSRSRSHARW